MKPDPQIKSVLSYIQIVVHFCNFGFVLYYQDTRNHFKVSSAQTRSASSYREPIQSTSLMQSHTSLGKPDVYVRDRPIPRSMSEMIPKYSTRTVKSDTTVTQQGNRRRSINKIYRFLSHGDFTHTNMYFCCEGVVWGKCDYWYRQQISEIF